MDLFLFKINRLGGEEKKKEGLDEGGIKKSSSVSTVQTWVDGIMVLSVDYWGWVRRH